MKSCVLLFFLRERPLFMAGVGTEKKVLCALKKVYPTICLSQIFFTSPKENSKTRLLLCLGMVYAFTLPLCSKIILLPHLTQHLFVSYLTILSSVPTPVINNDRSPIEKDVSLSYNGSKGLFVQLCTIEFIGARYLNASTWNPHSLRNSSVAAFYSRSY